MAPRRYAHYEPQTKISEDDCVALRQRGGIELTRKQCSSIETALREYEHLSFLWRRGEGKNLKKALRELEADASAFIKSVEALQIEPGNIWGYLLDKSKAEISCLGAFFDECAKLNRSVNRRGARHFHSEVAGSFGAGRVIALGGKHEHGVQIIKVSIGNSKTPLWIN
jgi:hypothetical protein